MDAVALALDALFADGNIACEAVYTPEGGVPVLVRVVTRRADDVSSFGDARLWSETTRIDLRVAEVPARVPATGSRSTARRFSFRASRFGTASGSSGPST